MAEDIQGKKNQDAASDTGSTKHDNRKVNGHDTHNYTASSRASDPDAQEMLISSLRSQIQDLFSQVTGLNNKLVTSYDRVSDLEDSLHVASANLRASNIKISQLELERTEHLSALNTGLLVEKSHVTSELSRLMEKATEEAAQRGQAESARAAIEKDLDDLSASLFGQANSMVAEARYAQHLSERKAEASERGFKGAEEAVQLMQQQMQTLQADKEDAEQKFEEMQLVMGKGKWVERRNSANGSSGVVTIRLLSSHTPYQEFLLFVAHLRTIHYSTPQPPTMTTLLHSPFLVRLLTEDSEPTVRLDLAPSLNWLSRRSVLSAIHGGQLTIEPISTSALLQESLATPTSIPGLNNNNNGLACALCGTPIFSTSEFNRSRPLSNGSMALWGTALFKKSSTNAIPWGNSRPPSPPRPISRTPTLPQIHIFRLAPQTTNSISTAHHSDAQPSHSNSSQSQPSTVYPLCPNGWCLARLRTTCILWAFVRTGIVEKVWEEEMSNIVPPSTIAAVSTNGEKPPVPPRRRGLWKMASALGERAASWSEGDKDKKRLSLQLASSASVASSPLPTPSLPPPRASLEKRRLPPPPVHPAVAGVHSPIRRTVPPPLPKRSEVRRQPSPPTVTSTPTPPQPVSTSTSAEGHSKDTEDTPDDAPAVTTPSTRASSPPPPPPQRSPLRPTTPANVPLPESRPHTPPILVGTTPAATPPPLPRRAAARGSRLIPEGVVRPGTPGTGQSVSFVPDTVATKVDEDKAERVEQNEEPTPLGETGEPAQVAVEDVKERENETEIGTVDAERVELPVDVEVSVEREEGEEEEEQMVAASSSTPHDRMEASTEEEIDDTLHIEKQAINSERAADGNDKDWEEVHAEDVNVRITEAQSDGSKEAFIGDTTWEERTWKELTRLREEMFWARIGALRQ